MSIMMKIVIHEGGLPLSPIKDGQLTLLILMAIWLRNVHVW